MFNPAVSVCDWAANVDCTSSTSGGDDTGNTPDDTPAATTPVANTPAATTPAATTPAATTPAVTTQAPTSQVNSAILLT